VNYLYRSRLAFNDAEIGKAVEMSLADWRRQTAVNLDGVFLSVKHAVPAMRRAGGGSIIITSSTAGLRGSAGLAGYCATKGGVRLFANPDRSPVLDPRPRPPFAGIVQ
jgi:NAD(P)-dependent dehydrogenase (short-subunit alcohol dehydrogenase family)